jgi:membrane fusion protein (multidrug efflux system)
MSGKGRRLIWSLVAAGVLAAGGTGLHLGGKLPFGGPKGVAAADSTAVAAGKAKSKAGKPEVMPVPVELARVDGRGIAAYYRAASVIEADRLVELVGRTTGRVRVVSVEEGDWVEARQVLAELENDRERIMLQKAELMATDKKRLRDRSENMLAEQLISREEFDAQDSAYRLAVAERDLAAISLEETLVRAPFAGQLTERRVVPGQLLALGAPAFSLGDFSPLRVRVHLPEAVARKVTVGQRVLVAPEAAPADLEAEVERISPVVDPATSTVRLTLLLADGHQAARVGGFVKVRITTDQHHEALAVPKTALVEEGALRNVFVAEADTVRKVEVETGLYDETHVEIVDGLFVGDFVVTMGQGGLRTGSPIKALNGPAVGYGQPSAAEREPGSGTEAVAALATEKK